jgi:hypothetical protein
MRAMWLDQFVQDLRFAWRGMRQSPTYVALTVLTLAVGLGLVTVAFTVFNTFVLRPFAVRDPASLYRLGWRTQDDGGPLFRWRDYEELRDRRDLFDGVIAESARFVSSNGRPLAAFLVSGSYFETLGMRFALGRPLASGESGAAGNTVVLSLLPGSPRDARGPGTGASRGRLTRLSLLRGCRSRGVCFRRDSS